jgi:hypothetical protein
MLLLLLGANGLSGGGGAPLLMNIIPKTEGKTTANTEPKVLPQIVLS